MVRKMKIRSASAGARKPVLIWHSAVHEHFKEQLYYLLMTIKPLDDARVKSKIKSLLMRYGVGQFCVYQVFGSFDMLLRVWLPSPVFRDFTNDMKTQIDNLHSLIHFQALQKLQCSQFYGFREETKPAMKSSLSELTTSIVRKVQKDSDAKAIDWCINLGFLRTRDADEQEEEGKYVKAFIAFSAPLGGLPNTFKDKIIDGLAAKLNDKRSGFDNVTILEGVGFGWILAKVVAKDFHRFGKLARDVASEFGPSGVASSTFLVSGLEDSMEGDCVSEEALRQAEPVNNAVAAFIPELYTPDPPKTERLKRAIEEFVQSKIIRDPGSESQLARNDSNAMHNFLIGVMKNDREAMFEALFVCIIRAESDLRKPLVEFAKRCTTGVDGLLQAVQKYEPNGPKRRSENFTILDSMRGAFWILSQLDETRNDEWVKTNLQDSVFQNITKYRNYVMHAKEEFELQKNWIELAQAMLDMFRIHDGIVVRYQKLLKSVDKGYEETNL